MIISVHVPKCGGMSFLSTLRQVFTVHVENFEAFGEIPDGTTCIHGHFQSNKYDSKYPEIQKITWIREPILRIISNYLFDMNGSWSIDGLKEESRAFSARLRSGGVSIVEYAERYPNGLRNYIVDTRDAFEFIGIVDYWDVCMKQFLDRFAPGLSISPERVNVQDKYSIDQVRAQMDGKVVRKLKKLNSRDYYLYESVKDSLGV